MAKAPSSWCRGPGFDPGQEAKIAPASQHSQEKNKSKTAITPEFRPAEGKCKWKESALTHRGKEHGFW